MNRTFLTLALLLSMVALSACQNNNFLQGLLIGGIASAALSRSHGFGGGFGYPYYRGGFGYPYGGGFGFGRPWRRFRRFGGPLLY